MMDLKINEQFVDDLAGEYADYFKLDTTPQVCFLNCFVYFSVQFLFKRSILRHLCEIVNAFLFPIFL